MTKALVGRNQPSQKTSQRKKLVTSIEKLLELISIRLAGLKKYRNVFWIFLKSSRNKSQLFEAAKTFFLNFYGSWNSLELCSPEMTQKSFFGTSFIKRKLWCRKLDSEKLLNQKEWDTIMSSSSWELKSKMVFILFFTSWFLALFSRKWVNAYCTYNCLTHYNGVQELKRTLKYICNGELIFLPNGLSWIMQNKVSISEQGL